MGACNIVGTGVRLGKKLLGYNRGGSKNMMREMNRQNGKGTHM